MKKFSLAMIGLVAMLSGCGAPQGMVGTPVNTAVSQDSHAAFAAKSFKKFDRASFDQGLKAGQEQVASYRTMAAADPLSYDYGYVVGLLRGSIASFGRISGSFDTAQWKSFAYMNRKAMTDALESLQKNPELAAKYGVTVGILLGGIDSFDSIHGSFDSAQWKEFAYSNERVLKRAYDSLIK